MRRNISLDDKYALDATRAYLTGIEALVRLPILQHQRDLDAGLNTAGFVSGYRGSPLGGVDQSMWKAQKWLQQHNIHFQPGVNEDLAATAVWGTQQVHLLPRPKYDGVFGMWYGKGPGVDRSMDVFKHANAFGATKYGGVLAVAGDDHACKSSSLPHQSEHMFIGAAMPVLNPANVQDVLDYGIYGWALSRYSGCWVALKAITENMDAGISADINPARVQIKTPDDFNMPPGGLNAKWPTTPLAQEALLHRYRIYAARGFALANNLNKIILDSPNARLGVVTSGKSHADVMEALHDLGVDKVEAEKIGLRIYKVGMSWPLEPVATHEFARGLKEILVVEEKRSVIEDQITGQLYNWPVSERPVVVGEFDESRRHLVTNLGELTPDIIAQVIGARVLQFHDSDAIKQRLEFLRAKAKRLRRDKNAVTRPPYFCSGCPHNTSTRVPDGSIGMAGIGCHYMARWMQRRTELFTHMGGEGATWIGQAPFTETEHVFQNIGDGTYFHSGILAIRAALAAGVNITYKILYNDAVAMTGGQSLDGVLRLRDVVAQMHAEGVKRIAVVAEDLPRARRELARMDANDLTLHARGEFDLLQTEIRKVKGVSVIVFDQTCAAEKRRRRKRGALKPIDTRVFINDEVCEGCGDCSATSNCLSVLPRKTELGVKRQIDQSACNMDLSCTDGFCPSFVTVTNFTAAAQTQPIDAASEVITPEPQQPALQPCWNILVAGVGGTGVLTVGSVLAMAAHIEGRGCSTLNQTGLAQKFGAVVSHVRIAETQDAIHAVRIADGHADLLLGCDLVVAAMPESLAKLDASRAHAVVNDYQNPTADFIHERDYEFPAAPVRKAIEREAGAANANFINATRIARGILGDSIGANLFLLGYAYQRGWIPLAAESIAAAVKLNNVAVEFNLAAFALGRRAAVNPRAVLEKIPAALLPAKVLRDLDAIVEWRRDYLREYQNEAYAASYVAFVEKVRAAETRAQNDSQKLSLATAKNLFRLMAYKDEYEVARLYSNGAFKRKLKAQFGARAKIRFHLAPALLCKTDTLTGRPIKRQFPAATMQVFRLLAKLKFLRGGALDIFGKTAERRAERALIGEYRGDIESLLKDLRADNLDDAADFANLADNIKGFGPVKMQAIENYRRLRQRHKMKIVR